MVIVSMVQLSFAKLSPSWQVQFELGLSLALVSVDDLMTPGLDDFNN